MKIRSIIFFVLTFVLATTLWAARSFSSSCVCNCGGVSGQSASSFDTNANICSCDCTTRLPNKFYELAVSITNETGELCELTDYENSRASLVSANATVPRFIPNHQTQNIFYANNSSTATLKGLVKSIQNPNGYLKAKLSYRCGVHNIVLKVTGEGGEVLQNDPGIRATIRATAPDAHGTPFSRVDCLLTSE